jgi:ATP-dependent DNA helicase DinG
VASVELSPVNVGPALNGLVWTRHETKERGEDTDAADEDSEEHRLSVTAVSATVPTGFAREAGLDAVTGDYETPFAQAYARSRLLVPRLGDADAEAVTAPDRYRPGRRVFDAVRHRRWAAGCITELVEANGGRALVLAATTVSGRAYADALRDAARGRWQVRSQWEPATTGQIVDAWRADTASVLVGTRGLFTGVDAPGDTCSLVVIDRIPRARPNPVDDARRDAFASDLQLNRWEADVLVYVSDAAVTLEQGVGRLIRSTGDSGLVAVLDPRLAGGAVKQLSPGSVAAYRKVLGVFPDRHQRFSTVEHARRFLAANEPAGAA